MNNPVRKVWLCWVFALGLSLNLNAADKVFDLSKLDFKGSPWNMDELSQTPKFSMEDAGDSLKAVIFEAMDYRGKKKEVFAYYSTPGILKGDPSLDKNLPAVVCAHGGSGRAFDEWVILWASRGYAAICVDQRGFGAGRVPLENGFKEVDNPPKSYYFKANEDQSEDWFYQAIGDVVMSHSLIRSFPEVDAERTALVGISWGGIITTLVAGLDDRFKVASPVYGSGYLYATGTAAVSLEISSEFTQQRWYTQYDPALYISNAKMPMLFVNGTNDAHFFNYQWQTTVDMVKNVTRSVRHQMKHSHYAGWAPEEIYDFVGKHLGVEGEFYVPEFLDVKNKKGIISCTIKDAMPGYKAYLVYSKDDNYSDNDKWEKLEIAVSDNKIAATVEADYLQWFITIEQTDESNFSTDIFFR